MENKYVIRTENGISQPMSRKEAIQKVKEYDAQGVSAYIVSEAEGERLKTSEFNTPKWS